MGGAIRVLVADDHAIVREGLHALLSSEPGMEVIGEAGTGSEAVTRARELRPDVVLLDMLMPEMNGEEVISEILRDCPHARILVLTSFAEDEKLFPAIHAGALGYLLKDTSPQDLLRGIHAVSRGEAALHPAVARKLLQEMRQSSESAPAREPERESLSGRELDVLRLVARGYSNQEIARDLVVTERTVRAHVSAILAKLHLHNRTQAALYALRTGVACLDESVTPDPAGATAKPK